MSRDHITQLRQLIEANYLLTKSVENYNTANAALDQLQADNQKLREACKAACQKYMELPYPAFDEVDDQLRAAIGVSDEG